MPVSTFPFKGRYEGKDFTVDDVISSLSAQQILIRQAVGFLEDLDPDFTADKVRIRVISIEEGSLEWSLFIEVWGKYQAQITEKVTGNIEKVLGVDIPEAYEPFIAFATMAVVFWGLQYTYDRVKQRKERDREDPPAPAIHIEGNYNTIIQLMADRADTSAERVNHILNESLFRDRAKVATAATDFIRPAKVRATSIAVAGTPGVTPEVIGEVPSDIEIAKTWETDRRRLDGVILDIRGTDRDSHHAGWRAVIEGDDRFPKRLPLVLLPAIDPEELANHARVRADVIVEGERFFDGSYIARRIHLLAFEALAS